MADYNIDTIENKVVVEAQEAVASLDKIIGNVNQAKSAINSMRSATGLKNIDKQAKTATSSLTKMQLISQNLKKAFNLTGLLYTAKKLYGFLNSATKNTIDYAETLNLFEVSMGKTLDQYGNLDSVSSKYYTKALKFQKQLNESFGTNIEETMRYQALYNQMAESMGIGDSASYLMSENLTKLGIDLASLFNKDESTTMEALRAGVLAGQTKPLRNYGLDVTQQSLSPLLGELGIDRSVKQLSQAEKMILRYIAVLRQASSAHGDFAKTIESPANQLKVFKQQFAELKTVAGSFFMGLLGQILPYVNAILMVIKEVLKAVAGLFGFKISSSNSNLASTTGIDDLDEGLSSSVGSAKELKKQLMGFDEINNITEDTNSGGGGGVSSTGIDKKLLEAMSEYDNLMGKVQMKATEIRDKIMEWLGFTKKINPLTGEIGWEFTGLSKQAKIVLGIIEGIIGLAITVKIIKIIGAIIKLKAIIIGTTTATTSFSIGLTAVKNGIIACGASAGAHASTLAKFATGAISLTAGIVGLSVSTKLAHNSLEAFGESGEKSGTTILKLTGSIAGATASGALLGSVIPRSWHCCRSVGRSNHRIDWGINRIF